MKKFILLAAAIIAIATSINAQEKLKIYQGQTLEYTVSAGGSTFPMEFDLDSLSDSNMELTWHLDDRSGRFISSKASLDSAAGCYYQPPQDNTEVSLPPSLNFLRLSKATFKILLEKKQAIFDESVITLTTNSSKAGFMMGNRPIDALYAESETGAKIWVLNNPDHPFILKLENNPSQVDVVLVGIRNNYKIPQGLLHY